LYSFSSSFGGSDKLGGVGGGRGRDLQGKDNEFALLSLLQAGVSVRLEAGKWGKRDLLLPRILPTANQ
jgi:hypothetical protein